MQPVPLSIQGSLADEGFLDWIDHRAQLLGLKAAITRISDAEIQVTVSGPMALIDAMEAACSLGPASVLVDRIVRKRAA